MSKERIAIYTEEYLTMKEEIKAQTIFIILITIIALISCIYNMKQEIEYAALNQEKQALEELAEMQKSMINDLEINCTDLFIQVEELKEEYVYGKENL